MRIGCSLANADARNGLSDMTYPELFFAVSAGSSSSKRILIEGVISSSNCPDLTAHRKTKRNPPAIRRPAAIKIYIALICSQVGSQMYRPAAEQIMTYNRTKNDICHKFLTFINCRAFSRLINVVNRIMLIELAGIRIAATTGFSSPCTAK